MSIDVEKYWSAPPPEQSPRLFVWLERIRSGWRPNRRVRGMGYVEASQFYGVYIWEYQNVIRPLLKQLEEFK